MGADKAKIFKWTLKECGLTLTDSV